MNENLKTPPANPENMGASPKPKIEHSREQLNIMAGGLLNLEEEELRELDKIVTPAAAQLLVKAFGTEFGELIGPLFRNDQNQNQSQNSNPTPSNPNPEVTMKNFESLQKQQKPTSTPSILGQAQQNPNDIPTSENELRKIMNDPGYWRDHNPALMDLVRKGFEKLYPNP